MSSSHQPETVEYWVVSDILYLDGHTYRKGETVCFPPTDLRLGHLLAREVIRPVDTAPKPVKELFLS